MLAWLACGRRVTDEVRAAATGAGAAGRFLVGYVLLLAFVQSLPLDLTLSPYQVYHKVRDGGVRVVPFGEFRTLDRDGAWGRAAALLKLAGLYLPVGLLAGCLPAGHWAARSAGRVALAVLALALAIEAAQVLVYSRTTSATDAVVGAAAAFLGWVLVRLRSGPELGPGDVLGLGSWWLGALGVVSWEPFAFAGPARPFDWVPGSPLEPTFTFGR